MAPPKELLRGLISQERIDLLHSWRHSGFSVHNRTTVYPADTEGLHKLACYLMRAPVNLSRLRFDRGSGLLVYESKPGHELVDDALTDPLEFIARVLIHVLRWDALRRSPATSHSFEAARMRTIPEPNKHLVHFYGAYANRIRQNSRETIRSHNEEKTTPSRRAANKRWAELIYRIYEVDPLTCNRCGGEMKILAFITEPAVIRTILDHRGKIAAGPRAPPEPSSN